MLFLDELSQVKEPNAIRQLNDLMAIGRSKKINVILATQYPTKDVIGKVDLTNVGARFVGRVATSTQAYIAAGRGDSGAYLLPDKGAFLRIDGRPNATRLQAYWLDDAGTEALVDAAIQRWGKAVKPVTAVVTKSVLPLVTEPVSTGYNQGIAVDWPVPAQNTTSATEPVTAVTVRFPLPTNRPPSPAEALALRQLYAELGSISAVTRQAYNGNKNKVYFDYVKQALSEGGA